ncbi:hypothetical protein KX928_18855 [Roseobacter sp. YSTF-M11]|uniref:Uncharacterized protein n=1 Tax=Roseobacter insulae TaxID=2859783 RepID=A0A9X1FYT9_9RHOB|nr:hypothetical protein [Roseobacter insulae]MBW4709849.1 hypothetical protein [Roseobacter insulae]
MRQDALIDWIPKVIKDFEALLHEDNVGRIATIYQPITVLVGAQTHPHTMAIADCLERLNPRVVRRVVAGAGHLGPFTMRDRVNSEILDHVFAVETEHWVENAQAARC